MSFWKRMRRDEQEELNAQVFDERPSIEAMDFDEEVGGPTSNAVDEEMMEGPSQERAGDLPSSEDMPRR